MNSQNSLLQESRLTIDFELETPLEKRGKGLPMKKKEKQKFASLNISNDGHSHKKPTQPTKSQFQKKDN